MNEIRTSAPFEGCDTEYKPIDDILGQDLKIIDYKLFENDKGEGAFLLCMIGEELFHICTHSVSLVGAMKNPKVAETLDNGDTIATRIVKRKSTKSDRMVYSFE